MKEEQINERQYSYRELKNILGLDGTAKDIYPKGDDLVVRTEKTKILGGNERKIYTFTKAEVMAKLKEQGEEGTLEGFKKKQQLGFNFIIITIKRDMNGQ